LASTLLGWPADPEEERIMAEQENESTKPVQGTKPKTPEERESPRRGTVARDAHDSTLVGEQDEGDEQPGENVLGGADAVPLTNDTPPKHPNPFEP
jgi:hypothetical protein